MYTGAGQALLAAQLLPLHAPQRTILARRLRWHVYVDAARCYGLILGAFFLLVLVHEWWIALLSFVVIGTQQYALFILGHDGMHSNLLPKRTANDRLTTALLYAPLGMYLASQRSSHLTHHRLLGTVSDPDRYLHSASNKATHLQFVLFLTGLLTFPRTVLKVSPFGKPAASGAPRLSLPRVLARFVFARWPSMVAQVVILAAISSVLPWWYYFAFWALPIYLLVFLPDEVRAFCEHAQPIVPDSAADERRLITFVPNPIERLFFSPMNMNYHAEHHLWPFMPYYSLPSLHALVQDSAYVEVRHSYVGFLWRYLGQLPLAPRAAASPQIA